MRTIHSRTASIVSAALVLTMFAVLPAVASEDSDPCVTVTIRAGEYLIDPTDGQHEIIAPNLGRLLVPGTPKLPSKIYAIAIPPGAEMTEVSFETGEGVVLSGKFDLRPTPLPRVIGEENPAVFAREQRQYEDNYTAVYSNDNPYPQAAAELVRMAGYRKYSLVDVRVTPFSYRPISKQLTYYPEITVKVGYRLTTRSGEPTVDNLVRTEDVARDIIINYDESQSWYPAASRAERGLHDFVIITLDSLTSSVAPLVTWETIKGRTVEVVTTTWINTNYTGYDLAEKIRNFLREKYPSAAWGIEDVLMVGHYDDVPMRRGWQDQGYGQPETDYYYAELSLPDSESWDADGDHHWGEDSDPIDFYAEVNVGRIPWSDPATVQNICEKSVAYEQNEDPAYKKNILLLGGYFWADTDNAEMMEAKVDQFWMSTWTITRMYEQNSGYWSTFECDFPLLHDNVMDVWPENTYGFVNWAGHGSPTSCHIAGLGAPAFISASDCSQLNDDYPAIIFADACSNSDTDDLNIGQAMLAQGGVGFVGATKVAYGTHAWDSPDDGSSQSMDYFFTTYVTSEQYTQGAALQACLREMYVNGYWYYDKYETFEWGALWGNPNLGMGAPPVLSIMFPNGVPEVLSPNGPTELVVEIYEGGEEAVPDSAMIHTMYDDGGVYEASLMTPLGDGMYLATLPAPSCADAPKFYFTVEGTQSGTVTQPPDGELAPFTADAGEVIVYLEDNFETDLGWAVENIDVLYGAWERGVPVGGGDRQDPANDYDGSGQCYLTENTAGNSDVDGGPTRLISPTIDLSNTTNPVLRYARWWKNDDHDFDPMDVEVSNDDGDSWVLIERVIDEEENPATDWVLRKVYLNDFITPSANVKIRFSAMDTPNNSINEGGIDAVLIEDIFCNQVTCVQKGDLNNDSVVDGKDISAFADCCLNGEPGTAECVCADIQKDGNFSADDISAFVTCLLEGECPLN